jgi:hypothetical protein
MILGKTQDEKVSKQWKNPFLDFNI